MAEHMPKELRDEIVDLAIKGVPPVEIRRKLGAGHKIGTIYAVLCAARKRGLAVPKFPAKRPSPRSGIVVRVTVWQEARIAAVMAAAKARRISTTQLINRLVDVVLSGEIGIDAVLDDGVTSDGA